MGDESFSPPSLASTSPVPPEGTVLEASPGSSESSLETNTLQEQLKEAQQRIQSHEKWQLDLAHYLTGQEPNPPVESFDTGETLVQEYRQKHPDLTPYEDYIALEITTLADKAAREGRPITQREAFEEGIRIFQEKLHSQVTKAQQQFHQQAQSQAIKRMAMRLDTGGVQPQPKTGADAIWAMSNEEFAKYKDDQIRKAYGL